MDFNKFNNLPYKNERKLIQKMNYLIICLFDFIFIYVILKVFKGLAQSDLKENIKVDIIYNKPNKITRYFMKRGR